MIDIIRHVAKVANTDQRCVVAFMQIPNREDHALVIPTDNLPPRFEQAVMDILKTNEGQTEETFAKVLSRHRMPDSQESVLEALHKQGKLVAVPVSNILMLPRPNQPVKLSFILEQLGRLQQNVPDQFITEKFNPHTANQRADMSANSRAIAQNLMVEAEMLEAEARKKRKTAHDYDPTIGALNGAAAPQAQPEAVKSNGFNPWGGMTKVEHTPYDMVVTHEVAMGEAIPGFGPEPPAPRVDPENVINTRLDAMEAMLTKMASEIFKSTVSETTEIPIEKDTQETDHSAMMKLKPRAKHVKDEG